MNTEKKFDYVSIDTNSISAWDNNYCNAEDWKREVQGRPIDASSLNLAFQKVNILKYGHGTISVHSFYPEKGIAYAGQNGNPNLIIKWDVKSNLEEKVNALLEEVKELKAIIKAKIEGL